MKRRLMTVLAALALTAGLMGAGASVASAGGGCPKGDKVGSSGKYLICKYGGQFYVWPKP